MENTTNAALSNNISCLKNLNANSNENKIMSIISNESATYEDKEVFPKYYHKLNKFPKMKDKVSASWKIANTHPEYKNLTKSYKETPEQVKHGFNTSPTIPKVN